MNVSINIQQHFFPFKKISEKKYPPPKKVILVEIMKPFLISNLFYSRKNICIASEICFISVFV